MFPSPETEDDRTFRITTIALCLTAVAITLIICLTVHFA